MDQSRSAPARKQLCHMTQLRELAALRPEEELRARLAEGGTDHKYVVPGGAWWKHTQWAIAEMEAKRAGDTKRLEKIAAERKDAWEVFERELIAS